MKKAGGAIKLIRRIRSTTNELQWKLPKLVSPAHVVSAIITIVERMNAAKKALNAERFGGDISTSIDEIASRRDAIEFVAAVNNEMAVHTRSSTEQE